MKYELGKDLKNNLKKITKYSKDLEYYEKYLKFCELEMKDINLTVHAHRVNDKISVFNLEFFERLQVEREKQIENVKKKIETIKEKIDQCEDILEEKIHT